MKTFVVVLVIAALGWWSYRHGYLKPEWVGLGSSPSTQKGAAEDSLQDILNRGLPRMVGNDISVDRARVNNLGVSFDFRLVDMDQFAVAQKYGSTLPADMQKTLVADLCLVRAVRDQVLAKGQPIQMQIRAQDGRTMFTSELRPGGC